ncbi:PREDICTED: probable LRR receptor-like serine/threonine-protein kinase At1g51820 [Tarenaya hassleriana]|uniref:probable LRR receptor-like serine/threonine-protein kinase At1g51820 n=1 Tax=Tarenaya hassleriana TaxID=28532 RepID=UPI00053C8A28|nr:PREDICTED: probable LRR receptor-like serine/threonine-protein kinase At1g51820 [Tarenaya hassleriana]
MESLIGILFVSIAIFSVIHLVHAQNQQGFITLDCGLPPGQSPYVESVTGLTFTSDTEFVESGKSGRVQKEFEEEFRKQYLSLRYFPDGERNCYNLNVTQNTNYMIRAFFLYGNYDGRNTYPEFDLHIGPNMWDTIDMTKARNGTGREIIHIARSSILQVCLVKTGTTVPIISVLELRPMRNDTYIAQSGSLKLSFREYYSDSVRSIRYPDDVYDRRWFPYFQDDWTQINTDVHVVTTIADVPQGVVATAATPTNASQPLNLTWNSDSPTDQLYLYVHFAEIQTLRANDTRELNITWKGDVIYGPFSPPILKATTIYTPYPKKCDEGVCSLMLVKTSRSTLPPLINAMEVFLTLELPLLDTNRDDVAAVRRIKAIYELKRISWQGDPCVPKDFSWDGVDCSETDKLTAPRIVSLNLSSSGLTGVIPLVLQSLTQLQALDLSNNNLSGGVPGFLANMKSLSVINLSGNNLSGSVPQALLDRRSQGVLELLLKGNPKLLCQSVPCDDPNPDNGVHHKKSVMVPIIASVASAFGLIMVALVLVFVFRRKKLASADVGVPSTSMPPLDGRSPQSSQPSIVTKNRKFVYSEVQAMTNNFERVLGKGGFGVVYHGYVNDTEQVVVKMLSQSSAQGYKQFKAEVELLLRVHHKNLVSLVGYCDEGENLALIYEYMANGDLKEHLSGKRGGSVLSWGTRLKIVAEAAQGLEYLHNGCKPPMVHRDVKTTNILLNEHLQAKLADFGLSRSFPTEGETHVSTVVAGTPGYLDPEYYRTNWLTEKSDVYSFGIVLLEIITNRPVVEQNRERPHITEWVGLMLTRGDIDNITDPKLYGDYDRNSVWKVVELGMSCVNPSSSRRPNMSQVVIELNECLVYDQNSRTGTSRDMDSKSSVGVSMTYGTEVFPKAR